MARRARFARHSLRSSPRCSAYCSILTQKKSDMARACKRRTLPPCLPIALAPLCSGGSVPKAVVGAPSHGCLRCRPGRGMSLKDLNGKSTSVHREGSLRKPRRMQSTRDFFSGRVCAVAASRRWFAVFARCAGTEMLGSSPTREGALRKLRCEEEKRVVFISFL